MSHFAESPNLRHLRMVQVIGRVGGVSGAARELCTSQPAVTQALANLEEELGTPIFERCATGTYATPLGKPYLLRIDRFFEILDAALAQLPGKHPSGASRHPPQAERLMTGTQMRAVIVASETGRVSEIAHGLGLSADSLFRSARTLERALGTPMFDRTAQGPIPNKTGEMLAREFRRAVREIELARGEISLGVGTGNLELVIGALPMAGSHELAEATRRFMQAHPSVKVRLVSGEYNTLLADLTNSRIDMIFGMLRKPDWAAEVNEEILFRDSYCMAARPGHPLTRYAEVTPAELAVYPWVVPAKGTPRRTRIEAIFAGKKTQPSFHLETSSLAMMRALLLNSDAITLMTRSEVQNDIDLGILQELECSYFHDVLLKGVTTNGGWLPTPAHVAFLDGLRDITSRLRRAPRRPARRETVPHS